MTELQQQLSAFHRRFLLRATGIAALWGLTAALTVVVAAPWLGQFAGPYTYWVILFIPLLLPAALVVLAWLRRPDFNTVVLAADRWSAGQGGIAAAWELRGTSQSQPFAEAVAARAVSSLRQQRIPEPRAMRRLLLAMLLLLALMPLSRVIYAQVRANDNEGKQTTTRTSVKPQDAAMLAKDAGLVAEQAGRIGAAQQERLAEDIEQLARNLQAGPIDKERALRDANALADRAASQTESRAQRQEARDLLAGNDATRELAQALKAIDSAAINNALDAIANDLRQPDGGLNAEAAGKLRAAIQQAADAAPTDPAIRRAAEKVQSLLDDHAIGERRRREQQAQETMQRQGLDEQAIQKGLDALRSLDQEAIRAALEQFADAASVLRDIDPKAAKDLLRRIQSGQTDPEQAKRMAETASELARRLEINAETLRELVRQGQQFEGLEQAAREALERMQQQGGVTGAEAVPDWARRAAQDAMRQGGQGSAGDQGSASDGPGGDGGEPDTGKPSPAIEGGERAGVETPDTGRGEKDDQSDPQRLDPEKAGDEAAGRDLSGRQSQSSGVNTRSSHEQLPRRFRDAARRYFER